MKDEKKSKEQLIRELQESRKLINELEKSRGKNGDILGDYARYSADAILGINENGLITASNVAAKRLFSFIEGDVDGKNILELSGESNGRKIRSVFDEINSGICTERYIECEFENNSTKKFCSISFSKKESNGTAAGFSMVAHDISELKHAEQALRNNRENLRITLNSISDGVIATDKYGNVTGMNPVAVKLTGWQEDFARGRNINEIFKIRNSLSGKTINNPVQKVLSEGTVVGIENHTSLSSANGEIYQISDNAAPIKDENGEIVGAVMVFRDVTDKYDRQRALIESENRFRALTENTSDITIIFDEEDKIIYASPSIVRFGFSLEEMLGITPTKFLHQEDYQKLRLLFQKLKKTPGKTSRTEQFRFYKKDKSLLRLEGRFTNMLDVPGVDGIVTNFRDVTDRYEAEIALLESEEKFRLISEQSLMGIFIIQEGFVKYANKACSEITGYGQREIKNWQPYFLLSIVHEDDRAFVADQMKMKESGDANSVHHYNYRAVRKDGSIIWIEHYSKSILFNGKMSILATVIDITEKRKAEDELHRTAATLRTIFRTAPIGIGIVKNRMLTMTNERIKDLTGYSSEELQGKNARILYPDDKEYERVEKVKQRLFAKDNIASFETRWLTKDGRIVDIQASLSAIDNEDYTAGSVFTATDVTHKKRSEKALRESEERYRQIIENSGDIVYGCDLKGNITFINSAGLILFGYTRQEFFNLNYEDFVQKDYIDVVKKHYIKQYIAGEDNTYLEVPIVIKGGHQMWVSQNVRLLREGDKVTGFQAIARDISQRKMAEEKIHQLNLELENRVDERTAMLNDALEELRFENEERKRTQDELMKTNRDLEESRKMLIEESKKLIVLNEELAKNEQLLKSANASKDKFFSIIAHDLKNPLHSLMLTMELLVHHFDKLGKDTLIDKHRQIHHTARQLSSLLENLLQWSRSQSGRIEFEPEACSIKELVDETKGLFDESASKKNIQVLSLSKEDAEAFIDKNMIKTVFRNLLSNAIKFTQPGGIVRIKVSEKDEFVSVDFEDSGVGMARDDVEKLFRIDTHHTTEGTFNEKGTGLGLIISREFVDKNNGTISVESRIGQGSKFKLTLPKASKDRES